MLFAIFTLLKNRKTNNLRKLTRTQSFSIKLYHLTNLISDYALFNKNLIKDS